MASRNIFVYGTLRRGEHNNCLLDESKYQGTYETEPEYELRNFGVFPGLMLNGSTSVRGEVYKVNERTLEELDYHEGHPTFYRRMPIKLKSHREKVEAYVITNHPSYRDELPIIPSGDWHNR